MNDRPSTPAGTSMGPPPIPTRRRGNPRIRSAIILTALLCAAELAGAADPALAAASGAEPMPSGGCGVITPGGCGGGDGQEIYAGVTGPGRGGGSAPTAPGSAPVPGNGAAVALGGVATDPCGNPVSGVGAAGGVTGAGVGAAGGVAGSGTAPAPGSFQAPPAGPPAPVGGSAVGTFGPPTAGCVIGALAQPPPAGITPAAAAAAAWDRKMLPEPQVRMSPNANRDQFVNLPTWMWLDPASWAPVAVTAAPVPGTSLAVVATPVKVTWYLGDGRRVECVGPGTPFTPGTDPRRPSPDCGYTYRRSSAGQPSGRYQVRAAITWRGSWSATGAQAGGGALPTVQGVPTVVGVRVAELQSVNSRVLH